MQAKKQLELDRIFNAVSSLKLFSNRNNVPKIKNGAYEKYLNEYKSTEPHWIALHVNDVNITYSDSWTYP